ncbi:right-handed parallel beta-helix repeat-containing protein [Halocatena halophila]|uniref:right-handed parallel beta-helix repeat-containing protein n=1 Tax=Halocatena halophila TaxID=2814576 RepID=UPI002ED25DEA
MAGRDTRQPIVIGVAVALCIAIAIAIGVALLNDEDPSERDVAGTPLDGCTTIDTPGRYTLRSNVTDVTDHNCLRITADDVILEGGSHRIDGQGTFGTAGVLVGGFNRPVANVTVRNLTVTDWDDGIRYLRVTDGTVTATRTADNRIGITLLRTNNSRVVRNYAHSNAVYGISLQEHSTKNTLVKNRAAENTLFGIELVANASNNRLISNQVSRNEHGLALIGVDNTTVVNTTARSNRIAGIWSSESDGTTLVNNTVSNRFYGIYLGDQTNANRLVANRAIDNRVGLRLLHSANNLLAGNVATSNRIEGILLLASDNTVLRENHLTDNGAGVVVARSSNVSRERG